MSSLNKVQLIGRLGQDPDVRYTQSNKAVATISVATSQKYKNQQGEQQENTEWHRIVAWDKLAEICQQYLKKGDQVYFEGRLQTRKWEDKDGQERYTTEIVAQNMVMLGSKSDGGSRPPHPGQSQAPVTDQPIGSHTDLSHMDNIEDDLPF